VTPPDHRPRKISPTQEPVQRSVSRGFQILEVGEVAGATHPGVHGQTAYDDKLHIGRSELAQQLVEGWLAQLFRAAPVNRISL
jgi:hypothetical protein